jgi:hypothetical protein
MSESTTETAYERGRRHGETGTGPGSTSGGGGNFLTRKLGPLPIWAWALMALAGAIAFYVYQKKNASSSTSAVSAAGSSGTTNSSLIPQFVNQVYTNGSPPPAHNPRGGTESTPPPSTPSGSTTNWSSPYIVAVPNGSGGWMEAIFPNQSAVNTYYSDIGVTNGAYPNGLNNSQISAAVKKAGGNIAGTVANSGQGGLVQ